MGCAQQKFYLGIWVGMYGVYREASTIILLYKFVIRYGIVLPPSLPQFAACHAMAMPPQPRAWLLWPIHHIDHHMHTSTMHGHKVAHPKHGKTGLLHAVTPYLSYYSLIELSP